MEEDTKIKHVVSLVIDAALWERTKAAARAQEVTASRLVREAIRAELRRQARGARGTPP